MIDEESLQLMNKAVIPSIAPSLPLPFPTLIDGETPQA